MGVLSEYLNSQFSLAQNLDFFIRIAVACLCGACIGLERSKRYKEAGIRTHIIVCCAASLLMIVSKYGFADLTDASGAFFNGVRGADPARIAAQVVSGIGFLGAGVIFKHGSTIRGLTTAAGLWATAGIGLAVGAGLYGLGIFTTVLLALVQVFMHRFAVGMDSQLYRHLQFTVYNGEGLQRDFDAFLAERRVRPMESEITYLDAGFISYNMVIRTPVELSVGELEKFLLPYGAIRSISYTTAV